jgi:hypothetical protein
MLLYGIIWISLMLNYLTEVKAGAGHGRKVTIAGDGLIALKHDPKKRV